MKKLILFPVLLFLLLLPACRAKTYRNDLAPEDLAQTCAEAIGMEDPIYENAEVLRNVSTSFEKRPDATVCYTANGGNLDEFCIWRTDNDDVGTVVSFLNAYLGETLENNRAYYDSYIPEETPKLRDAEVRVYGSYAVYAVLSPEARKTFFATVESALTPA